MARSLWALAALATGSCALVLPARPRAATTQLRASTMNPMEAMAEKAKIAAYEASAAVIAAKVCSKVAEKADKLPDGMVDIINEFMRTYLLVVARQGRDPMSKVDVLKEYLGLVDQQLSEPFEFAPYHTAWTAENDSPHDHLEMDTQFMEPMLDRSDSRLFGEERVREIEAHLANGHNVVLLSNHQTEADPSCWSFALAGAHERLARDMIMVAGDRVTTDVVAVPFSKARNLLCIYSKRHIENPPEDKPRKMRHNAKTMTAMLRLFKGGGKCIWVAPSGGRDRPADGVYKPAAFDPKSIEMFRLMATKAEEKPTHFYPCAMMTHTLFPPPKTLTAGALGEPRIAIRGSVNIKIGPELDFDEVTRQGCLIDGQYPEGCVDDRDAAAFLAAEAAHLQVASLYDDLVADARERKSPYYG